MANDVPGNPNNPNNFPVIPGNTLEQTMPVFGDLALFPSIKKIYQKYFPNLDMSSGDYKEFNLERDKLPPEQQQAFMTELLADPMVQGAMSAPKSTVSVGPDAQALANQNPFDPSFGSPASTSRAMDAPPGGPPPGLDPLEKPPVPPFPSDKEQEDISDANTRQDMIQDMREGNLNPYTLTDAQLEFFTKGTGTTREQLAEMFNYDKPAEDPAETPVEDDDDAVDDEQATQDTIQDIRDGELNPYAMTDEELADIGLTRAQAEDIYGGELSEEEQRRYVEGTLGDYNTEETKKRNLGTLSDLFEEVFGDQIPKDEDEDSTKESGEFAEGEWDWLKNEPEANKPEWLRTIENAIGDGFPPPLTDADGNILPGVTITYDTDTKTWKGKVLIAVPGLPKWIQGEGFEVDIKRDGDFVIGDATKTKLKEIGEKIKKIPQDIADGIQKTIDGITEAGNSVKDIDIDKDGNVTGTILDSAGNVLDKLFIPANALLDGGVDSPGLIDFILKNRLAKGVLDLLGSDYIDFLKVKKKGDSADGSPPADEQPPDKSESGSPIGGADDPNEEKDPLDDEESKANEGPPDGERPPDEEPPDGERPSDEGPTDGKPTTEEPALAEGTLDELEKTSDGVVTSTDRPATGGDNPAAGDNPATRSQPLMNAFMGLGAPGDSLFGDTTKEGEDLEYFFDIGGDTIFAGKNYSNAEKRGIGALAKQSKELENLQRMVTPITGMRLPDRSKAARGGMVKNTFMNKLNDIMRYR